MLGHIGRRAAVLAAQRQALQDAQDDQDDGSGNADRVVVGQETDDEGGRAHDHDGDQEGVLAADHIAQTAEDQRAEWPHDEAGRKGEQGEDEGGIGIGAGKELLGDDGGERAVKVEVVPLEYCSQRGRKDDLAFLLGHAARGGGLYCAHDVSVNVVLGRNSSFRDAGAECKDVCLLEACLKLTRDLRRGGERGSGRDFARACAGLKN